MAQINLLQRNTAPVAKSTGFNGILVYLLFGVVLVEILIFTFLFIGTGSVSRSIRSLKTDIENEQNAAFKNPERDKLVTRQGQLRSADELINKHTFWSALVPEIAKVMVKSSAIVQFHGEENGELVVLVTVGNVSELEKFTQAFDLPQFSKSFSDVRLTNLTRGTNEVKAEYRLKFNTTLLRPSFSQTSSASSTRNIIK